MGRFSGEWGTCLFWVADAVERMIYFEILSSDINVVLRQGTGKKEGEDFGVYTSARPHGI